MRCEVIAVGTELLLGQIVDTNSSWIGEQLALAGIDSHFQTKVGDNHDRMVTALRTALDRSDAVIMCGGLGPTQDDITREVIAEVMGVELVPDDAIEARIRAMFGARGRSMAANNLRQALVPEGAATIAQMPGTAPGLVCPMTGPYEGKVVYAVPGVPYEMKEMVSGTVVPDLQERAGVTSVIKSRVLRTWGQSESGLSEMLHDEIERLDAEPSVTLAFLASGIEGIKVRITAKAPTEIEADELIAAEETIVRRIIGDIVFGVDDETMEHAVSEALRAGPHPRRRRVDHRRPHRLAHHQRARVVGCVPRRGGGLCVGGEVLGARRARGAGGVGRVRREHGHRGAPAARRRRRHRGHRVAGPAPQEDQPPGTVYFGVAIGDHVESRLVKMPGDRHRVQQFSAISLLDMLRRRLGDRSSR
jgi:nicotinamide-nucleotide amidase